MTRIAVDAMGGDRGPAAIVEGALQARSATLEPVLFILRRFVLAQRRDLTFHANVLLHPDVKAGAITTDRHSKRGRQRRPRIRRQRGVRRLLGSKWPARHVSRCSR